MRNNNALRNWAARCVFIVIVASYYFAYAIWKSQLTLLEVFGPRFVDYVLVVSIVLLVVNKRFVDRTILYLNILALAWHLYFDVIQNCRDQYMSSLLMDCGWFRLDNIWLPWWVAYWLMQVSLVAYLLICELADFRRKRILR
jgi:hypothetical protein